MAIDPNKVPNGKVFLDTSVFMLGLLPNRYGEKLSDLDSCRELFEYLIENRDGFWITSFTVAEYIRGIKKENFADDFQIFKEILENQYIKIASFDTESAMIVGKEMPSQFIQENKKPGVPEAYIKYDGLIIATAKRNNAATLLSLDARQRDLAKSISLVSQHPNELQTQLTLPMVNNIPNKTATQNVISIKAKKSKDKKK